ncbi:hypothetical protein KKI17_02520, partial [Patescibacteria group bacterium]|nr:hypothetical protein [Patescibacteria group bacterium]
IHYLQENPEETSTADYEQKLMHISAKSALWTTYKPPEDPELLRRIGENTNIAIISSESSLLEIGLRMMPERKSPCERQFNTLISSIAFN